MHTIIIFIEKKITWYEIRVIGQNLGHKVTRVKQLQNVWNENNLRPQGEIVLLALNNALCLESEFSPLQVNCKHLFGQDW